MSLINEALKQAKANMSPEAAPSREDASPPPPADAMSSAVFVAQPTRARSGKGTDIMIGMLIFLLLSLLLAAVAGGIYFIHSKRAAAQAPSAKQDKTTQTTAPSAKDTATPPVDNANGSKTPGSTRKPNPLAQSLNRAKSVAKTVQEREKTPTNGVARKQATTTPGNPAATGALKKTIELAPAKITRAFKLTGIVEGPTGRLALINGAIIKQGRAIADGRVLEIAKDYVILEVNRKKYRLEIPGDSSF